MKFEFKSSNGQLMMSIESPNTKFAKLVKQMFINEMKDIHGPGFNMSVSTPIEGGTFEQYSHGIECRVS